MLEFFEEFRSNQAAEKLKQLVATTTTVLRDGKEVEIPIKDITLGDIVILSAGSMIPADLRILESKDIYVGQSSLTAESDDGFYWWVVYNNAATEETNVIVKIHIEQPEQSTEVIPIDENSSLTLDVLDFDEDAAKVIAKDWYELENTHYIVSEITNPQPNTVYGVVNTTGVIEYKIYYLDRGWFNITFATDEENKIDYSIAYAQVPVYGMIDYRASINKKVWNQN